MAKRAYKRATRVADQIRVEVADILMRKAKDPRVAAVTVTGAEITDDLRLARVFVTTLLDPEREREAFVGLNKASGFIRSELGRRLQLRYVPELVFQKDTSGLRSTRLLSLLDQLVGERDRRACLDTTPPEGTEGLDDDCRGDGCGGL
jgi:ribosome-binding factor A